MDLSQLWESQITERHRSCQCSYVNGAIALDGVRFLFFSPSLGCDPAMVENLCEKCFQVLYTGGIVVVVVGWRR